MAGCQHQRHGCVAERDLLIVGRHDIALGPAVRILVDGFLDRIPIGTAHDDAGAETLLHQLGAADMIAVGMGDDDVFHRRGIEPELLQAADDRLLGGVVVEGVDQDDAFAASVNQVARSGGGGGSTSAPGAVCGAMLTRASVPVKSNPAAALAAAKWVSIRWVSIVLACCANAPAMPSPAATASAAPIECFMVSSPCEV